MGVGVGTKPTESTTSVGVTNKNKRRFIETATAKQKSAKKVRFVDDTSTHIVKSSNIDETTAPKALTRYESTLKDLEAAKRHSRATRRPAYLPDYIINAVNGLDTPSSTTPSDRQTAIPKTYRDAITGPHRTQWLNAIQTEYRACIDNDAWRLTTLPAGRRALPSKWVFDIKTNADGNIDKYKARLVIKGFRQTYGIDFDETFSPVARYESLKLVLATATMLDLEVHQMDVCTAFLNGTLDEEIYMRQPEGFIDANKPDDACRLLKSLYGLKQAGRVWYILLHTFLTKHGFVRCHKEYCIYILRDGETFTIIAVYVDELTLASSCPIQLTRVKRALSQEFKMKDLGEVEYLLKIEIKRDRRQKSMTLSQRKYTNDILRRFDMKDAAPVLTPQVTGLTLEPETTMTPDDVKAQPYKYPELVGALLHLARGTRPDIANAVRVCSKYMPRYNKTHWKAALRILAYLKGTSDYGLVFDGNTSGVSYQLYSDASFANLDDDRRSVTGYCVIMAGAPISCKTTRQGNITISTAEAELVACSEACRESEWIWLLLQELGFKQTTPVTIHCDNTSVVAIAKNPGNHKGTKHIEIRHLYVRQLIDEKRVQIKYCWTEDMIADILTKAVKTNLFLKLRHMLGVRRVLGSGSVGKDT